MDPRCTKLGQGFTSLLAHAPELCQIPNHQSGIELYEPGQTLWSHAGVSQDRDARNPTCIRLWITGPSGLRCMLPRWERGSWLHSNSWLVSTEEPVIGFTLSPLGTKLTFYIWNFLKWEWRDWLLHLQLMLFITLVVGSFVKGVSRIQLNANVRHLEQRSPKVITWSSLMLTGFDKHTCMLCYVLRFIC